MNKRKPTLVAILAMLLMLVGCDLNPQPSITPTPSSNEPTPTAVAIKPLPQSGDGMNNFAPYKPVDASVKPNTPDYSTDPTAAARQDVLDYYTLSPEARDLLTKNGFVVLKSETNQNIYDVYNTADRRSIPVIITTDPLLHTYHLLFDYSLRKIENDYLAGDAKALTAALLQATQRQLMLRLNAPNAQAALRRNLAYFAVAAKLQDDSAEVPSEVADTVNQELALIKAHAGFADSPLFSYKLDYSQFVPRGHYDRSDTLRHYFMGMMWYGLTNFRVDPAAKRDAGDQAAAVRMETRQALLITMLLADPSLKAGDMSALERWQRIYEPTIFFVGVSDDLSIYDYSKLAADTFGGRLSLGNIDDDASIDKFLAAAGNLPAPKINGGLLVDDEGETALKGWRFMGQRFIPDSYIFQQLVYNKVGTQTTPRSFPLGLDVTAVMGSDRARAILQPTESKFENYDKQMQKLRDEFGKVETATWTQNLYWNWLYSLKPLTEAKGAGYPKFMQNEAWTDRQLFSYLASWTELRHDTILYAKQSNTMSGMGALHNQATPTPVPEPLGYVEPQVELYARLEALAQQSKDGLAARKLLPADYAKQFDDMIAIIARLRNISTIELSGGQLSDTDYAFIRNFGHQMRGFEDWATAQDALGDESDNRMANIADVHTDPDGGKALEEGVGDAFTIIVIAPVGGQPSLLVGAQFSQYEFTQSMSDRLTDKAWQQQLNRNPPPLADWTASFIR